jgi:hypothetical protein
MKLARKSLQKSVKKYWLMSAILGFSQHCQNKIKNNANNENKRQKHKHCFCTAYARKRPSLVFVL